MTPDRHITDGHTIWPLCARTDCGLEITRPGHTQCRCDNDDGPLWELPETWKELLP